MYCGHSGWFAADIFEIGGCNVVVANGPVSPDNIHREDLETATHHMVDFPIGGCWKPHRGLFAVPSDQVTELTAEERQELAS